jgi:hypothetical protein
MLIALKTHHYAGQQHKAGEAYEARTARDARLLKALGYVAEENASANTPASPLPAPEPSPPGEVSDDYKPKRRYRRRDLTAET